MQMMANDRSLGVKQPTPVLLDQDFGSGAGKIYGMVFSTFGLGWKCPGNVPDMSQDTANVPSFPRTWGCPRTMWLEIG
jgi:hypothetical protein